MPVNKGGRPSGAAWAHKRPVTMRKASKAARMQILEQRDPLQELVRLGFEAETEELRIKALQAAVPFLHPRLSMSVIADATPAQSEKITQAMLVRELSERIAKLPTIEHEAKPIEPDTD